MASYTEHLNLLKKDPVVDASDTFNIQTMLNDNWDKIDVAVDAAAGKADSHAAQHAASGSDPVTPESIGAAEVGHSHAAEEITSGTLDTERLPTVPVSKGGTGLSSLAANRLIYPSAPTTLAQLSFPAVAGSVLRQGASGAPYWTSLASLILEMGGVKIATGSYTGTGTYGSSSPNRLTFGFVPKLVIVYENAGLFSPATYSSAYGGWKGGFLWVPGMGSAYTGSGGATAIMSLSGNTLSWYSTSSEWTQVNASGTVYNYLAIG